MANLDVISSVNGSPLIEEHSVGHWMAGLATNVVRVFYLNNEMTGTSWRFVIPQHASNSKIRLLPSYATSF